MNERKSTLQWISFYLVGIVGFAGTVLGFLDVNLPLLVGVLLLSGVFLLCIIAGNIGYLRWLKKNSSQPIEELTVDEYLISALQQYKELRCIFSSADQLRESLVSNLDNIEKITKGMEIKVILRGESIDEPRLQKNIERMNAICQRNNVKIIYKAVPWSRFMIAGIIGVTNEPASAIISSYYQENEMIYRTGKKYRHVKNNEIPTSKAFSAINKAFDLMWAE